MDEDISELLELVLNESPPEAPQNITDALLLIGTGLNRIADVLERSYPSNDNSR